MQIPSQVQMPEGEDSVLLRMSLSPEAPVPCCQGHEVGMGIILQLLWLVCSAWLKS